MSPTVLCAVMMTVALDYGYEEMPEGGIRYIIQIEPEMLDSLRNGTPMGSAIPPEVRGRVRAFHIVSNRAELSKVVPPLPEPPPQATPTEPIDEPPPSENLFPPDWQMRPKSDPDTGLLDPPGLLRDSSVTPAMNLEESPSPLDSPSGDTPPEEAEVPDSNEGSIWFLLMSVAAAGSSSGMLFFGWLAFDYRSRYLGLLRDSIDTDTAWIKDRTGSVDLDDSRTADAPTTAESSQTASDSEDDNIVYEDSSWKDIDADPDDPLDDWMNEENDGRRESRRES